MSLSFNGEDSEFRSSVTSAVEYEDDVIFSDTDITIIQMKNDTSWYKDKHRKKVRD